MISCSVVLTLVAATGLAAQPAPPEDDPLSSLVALAQSSEPIPQTVRRLVGLYTFGTLPAGQQGKFPLSNTTDDTVRALSFVKQSVVASWLDPLTEDESLGAPRFGANADYVAYFGNGWNSDWVGDVVGSAPQFNGDAGVGYIWVNHEYISNSLPTPTSAPTGQHLTFARFLASGGALNNDVASDMWNQADVDTYVEWFKRQLGGSFFKIQYDPADRTWAVDRTAANRRYDSTSATLLQLTGHKLSRPDHDDSGIPLPDGILAGIAGDCSGGQTPWGTVITAEENVQSYYGDLEASWTSSGRFIPGEGFDAGAAISPPYAASPASLFGIHSDTRTHHDRDAYGYWTEIDPWTSSGIFYSPSAKSPDGRGHRKIGAGGRARWENAAFATGKDWRLVDGKPVVMYGGNDRRGGRIYKLVSNANYEESMTLAEVRALLDDARLFVTHFADLDNTTGLTLLATGEFPTEETRGEGRWILLSVDSTDIAPNAAALGAPGTTVGAALKDVDWNGVGAFTSDNDVRNALYSAANKIGLMELNRPEDIEWNALDRSGTPRLYVAFTNHGRQVALNQAGVAFDPELHADQSPTREDALGAIFAMEEGDPSDPGISKTFTFWSVWEGTSGAGPFDAANPDNLAIDSDGNIWFGTDGNFRRNGTADAVYYLNLNPRHKEGEPGVVNPSYGFPFRVAASPSDSEATGPAFNSDETTLFFAVQHPGEAVTSTWPQ